MNASPVSPPPGGLSYDQLAEHQEPKVRRFLRGALAEEVRAGRVHLEGGVYSINTEAFGPELLAAFAAMASKSLPVPGMDSNGKVPMAQSPNGDSPSSEAQASLANDLAALLAAEPVGLPCLTLASRLHRRVADVLAVLRGHACFVQSGRTRGVRWRLTEMGAGRNGKEYEPRLGLALGQLMVSRLEAAERELALLRAQLAGREES